MNTNSNPFTTVTSTATANAKPKLLKPQTPENIMRRVIQLGLINLPNPLPPIPEIAEALRARINQYQSQLAGLDRLNEDHVDQIAECRVAIPVLGHKLSELHEYFPAHFTTESAPESGPGGPDAHSKPLADGPEVGQCRATAGQPGPTVGQPGPQPDQTGPSNTSSENQNTSASCDHDSEDQEVEHKDSDDDECEDADQEEDLDDFDDAGDEDEIDDDQFSDAAEEFDFHLNGTRSPLDQLSGAEQAAIVALVDAFSSRIAAAVLAEPPPVGLSLEIGKSSLNRFRNRYKKAKAARANSEKLKNAEALLDKSPTPHETFQNTIERQIKLQLLGQSPDPKTLHTLIMSLTRLRRQSLAERKQLHAEQKS